MTLSKSSRRRFLQSLGIGASMLPFVPILDAGAEGTPAPKRIVFFFSANGTIRESWLPSVDANGGLALSPILAPLEKMKSRLLVVDGLAHRVVLEKGDRSGHSAGMNTALTGRKAKQTDPAHNPLRSLATGISLDQYIADHIGMETKVRSMECGIEVAPFMSDTACLAYAGSLQPILPENSPYANFDRVFGDFTAPGTQENADETLRVADRQAVLQSVTLNLERVRARLPASDRIKMEAHLDAVNAFEHSLTTGVGVGVAPVCGKPDLGAPTNIWINDRVPTIAKLQMDTLVMALACDLTRVGTVQFGCAGAGHRFHWLGPEFAHDPVLLATDDARGFHAIAHRGAEPDSRAKLVKIHTWYAEQFATLLDRLVAIPERGGTMLDNTLVVWMNELGDGVTHSHENTPWVIAGNVGGFFKTGRLASFPNEPHNRLLLTLCHAMGIETDVFGDPDYCKAGPLSELLA